MKLATLAVAVLAGLVSVAQAQRPAKIVIMTVEDPNNYDAVNSMRGFADTELRSQGYEVTIVEGDKPQPNHFGGLVEALADADLLVLFVRRRFPPPEQLDAVRAYLEAGKPLVGIRTANHAFISRPNEPVAAGFATWPTFTTEVLGGENTGYETKGMPYRVEVAPGMQESPLLKDVDAAKIRGHASLYKVLPLAADAKPILLGTAQGREPTQPVAWTRTYGKNDAPVFYTSLGAPEDMEQPDVRRLLLNGVRWALEAGRRSDGN